MRLPETNGKWRLLDQLEEVAGAGRPRQPPARTASSATARGPWAAALVRCVQGDGNCAIGTGEIAGTLDGTLANGTIDLVFDGGIVPGYFYRVNIFVNELVGLQVPCDSAPVKLSKLSVMLPGSPTDGLTGETVAMVIDPEGNQTDAAICPSFVQQ